MDYVRESGASVHRRRRRRRAAITLTLLAMLLLGTFAYAAAYFQGWVGGQVPAPVTSPTCRVVAVPPVKAALAPKSVQLNVYNATNREGLAARTATVLGTQGFTILRVANDPIGRTIIGVGEVRHGPKGAAAAALVATRLVGARMITDRRTDTSVDVVLGNSFKAVSAPLKVVPKPAASTARSTAKPTSPSPVC